MCSSSRSLGLVGPFLARFVQFYHVFTDHYAHLTTFEDCLTCAGILLTRSVNAVVTVRPRGCSAHCASIRGIGDLLYKHAHEAGICAWRTRFCYKTVCSALMRQATQQFLQNDI